MSINNVIKTSWLCWDRARINVYKNIGEVYIMCGVHYTVHKYYEFNYF